MKYYDVAKNWWNLFEMEMERFDWVTVSYLYFLFGESMHINLYLVLMIYKIVESIEQQPVAEVFVGKHVFLTIEDYCCASKSD